MEFTLLKGLIFSVRWYRKAAEQGHASAQHNLGVMYTEGQGVPRDNMEAYKWAHLSALLGRGEVKQHGKEHRESLSKKMTPAQIAEANRLAREWLKKFNARKK